VRVAVCQFAPTRDVSANVETISRLAEAAAGDGARLLAFPEAAMFQTMSSREELKAVAQSLDGPFVKDLSVIAAERDVVMTVGMYEDSGGGKPYNTVVVVGPKGVLAHHRKFMVYDAFGYRESDNVTVAAPQADVFEVDGVKVGLITCYEVRFPETARSLVDRGADLLVVCSAWPIAPGKEDHFMTMVRARALENTVYVAASGDCSEWMVGRSHVIDPLGYQTAGLAAEPGHVCAEVDLARRARARQTLPVLEQRRLHLAPQGPDA
jgi:predicted amidohydrolase